MKLRIGLLCHDGVGGSVRVAANLAEALSARGHETHVFARQTPLHMRSSGDLFLHTVNGSRTNGQLVSELDTSWPQGDVEDLAQLVVDVSRTAPLDVLHFHYAVPFAEVSDLVRRRLGHNAPPVLGTLHGTDVSVLGLRRGLRRRLSELLARVDVLTTVSHSHAALAARIYKLRRLPDVIPNFVDTARFRPDPSVDADRRPRIAHVSNFRPVKQPLALASIFREVHRTVDADLWLIGEGEGMPPLLDRLARDSLVDRTTCLGLRLDLERILPNVDVLLVTSRTESFCLAALEAAACGVPAVGPRVGGLPETVVDRKTGNLFEPGDHEGAAAAIVRLLTDSRFRRDMASAAIEQAREFADDVIVPRYEELYAAVAEIGESSVGDVRVGRV
jgi:L-malate glycosyltransferase